MAEKNNEKITIFDAGDLARWGDLTEAEKDDVLQSMVDRIKNTILSTDKPDTPAE